MRPPRCLAFATLPLDVRVPPEVEAMIRRGLEKKAEDRTQTAVEYIAQIDEALGRESLAPDFPASQPDWRGPRSSLRGSKTFARRRKTF